MIPNVQKRAWQYLLKILFRVLTHTIVSVMIALQHIQMLVLNPESEQVMKNTKLKNAREKVGLTQVKVAEWVGITEVSYQNYEAGERIPRADIAIAIADTLGIKSYKEFKVLFGAATPDNTKNPTAIK